MRITDLLAEYQIPFRRSGESPHVTSGWIGVECPFCGKGSGRYGLGHNLAGGFWTCWKCGGHSPVEVLRELLSLPIRSCLELLGQLDIQVLPQVERPTPKLVLPPGIVDTLLPTHRRYLKRRGFDPAELIRLWGIQGIGMAPRGWAWRILIPVFWQGKLVTYTSRSVSDSGVRYKSAPKDWEAMPIKSVLYGIQHVKHAIVVHEGPTDVWRTGPGAVATCGVGYSRAQLRLIAQYPMRVICFDNESGAQSRARKLCRDLELLPGRTVNVILSGKDAASSPDRDVKWLRRFLD